MTVAARSNRLRRCRAATAAMALLMASPAAAAAGYDQRSAFPANPPLAHGSSGAAAAAGSYRFDLLLDVEIDIGTGPMPARVYVNSGDGSMLLEEPSLTLWSFGASDLLRRVSVHHLLVANRQALACGEAASASTAAQAEKLFGARRLCFGVGQLSPLLASEAEFDRDNFFDLAVASPPFPPRSRLPAARDGDLEMFAAETRGGRTTLWLEPGSSEVATQVPFLGPGVGVIKDPRSRRNRLVRHAWLHSPQNLGSQAPANVYISLKRLGPANHQVSLTSYRRITAFTLGSPSSPSPFSRGGPGIDRMNALSGELADGMRQVELMDRNGNCRGAQQQFASLMTKLRDYQSQHGLTAPLPESYRCRFRPQPGAEGP
ncbi:MAG: hypothetical protein AAFX65_10170 [Cyanobacteria bacterium J06638_7]